MKTAKDLLDELDGGGSRDDRDDWLAQRMRTAHQRVWDTQLPMIDTRGVPPDEDPWEDSWEKRIQRAFTGLEDIVGLGLKSTGQLAKGRAAQSDEMFNNFVRDIYEKSGREDTPPTVNTGQPGELIGALGDYFYNAGHTPEREKAFNPNNKWEGADLRDVIRQGKFGEYLTDTDAGFLYDLPYNLGNMAGFLLPTRAGSATRATRFAGEMLNPLSGLLGKAGATRAADFIGSKAAREALGSGVHFGTTMGPYGAMVNAGTIIDELKKQGKSDTEIADAMGNLVREELPADIAFAALTGNVVKGKLGNMIAPRGSSLGRKIAANAAGIPLEMAGGNLSNVNQMILSEKYSGQPYGELFGEHTPAENKAGFMGAMAGVPFALYGGGRGVVDARAADKAYERFQKYIAEGKDLREAALRDMPQMARDAYRDAQSEYESTKGINAFMRAISGQESDGNYDLTNTDSGAAGAFQIMPDNWATWAQDAGLSPDAPMTPENQDRVARNKMLEYYNKFGNWRDVAIAWYAGEGAVGYSEEAKNRPQYSNGNEYPSINAYADSVMSRFQNAGGGESGGRRGGYVGEGGKGEGTYWVRNDGVSFDGAQPQLLDAMDMLGKFVYDATGVKLVASAGTNGSHPSNGTPHGHDAGYKVDIVDAGANGVPLDANGVLFNSDFTPTEFCHKLIEYGRQLGLGMNLEGVGTQNVHLDVALDGTQWDGNGDHAGGFNPQNGDMRSDVQRRADELFDQRFRERVIPQRQEEPMKARQVDLNDSGLHDAFARDRMTAAIDNNDADAAGFWKEMFSGDTFNNTEENRAAVRQRYGTELEQFAQTYEPATVQAEQPQTVQNPTPRAQGQGQTQQQQAQPQQQKPAAKNTSNKYIRNNDVLQAGNNFLEELRAKGTQADMATTVRLQAAISNGDTDTVRNILKANNRPIVAEQQTTQAQPQQQTQTQTEPVKQNQPPENVIQQETPQQESTQQQQPTKPKKQPKTGEEKAQAVLNKPLQGKKSGEARRKAGRAVIFLADKNGIEISDADRKSLGNGKTAVVNQWRDILIGKGILSPQTTQSSPKQSSPAQSQAQQQTQQQTQETAQPAEKPLTLQERAQQIVNKATEAAGQNWEEIKRGYQERGRVAKSDQSIIAQQEDDALEDSLYRDDAEEERQAKAEQRQIRDDKQNDDNFEAELPTLRQAQYWLYDNGNEQAAREMEDTIRERSLYKAHLIADRTNVPQEILPRVPQQSDTGRRATPVQNPGTGFDALVTKARQYQNILLEDGDTQGAQAIEDAIQNRDEAALRDLPTTREEISAREEQTRRKKQDREVEAKRQRQEDDAVNAALATPSADEFSRKKQGARILGLINAKSFKDAYGTIELPPGLEQELQNGRRKGIETAQNLLRERGVTERTENPEATKERGQQQRDAYYDDELDAALEEPSKDKTERQERQLSGQKESADVPLKETKPTEAKTEEAKAKPEPKPQSQKTGEKVPSEGKPKRTQKSTSEKIQEIAQNTKEKLSTILKLDKYTLLAKEVFEKIDSNVFEFDNGTTKGVKAFRERCEDFVRQATSIENIDEFAQKRELERFGSELSWMGPDSVLVGRSGWLRERASDGAYSIKLSPQEQKAAVKKLSEQREEAKRKVNSGEATPAQALEELREARQKVFADIKKTLTDRAGGPDAITRWSMEGEADTRITNVIEDESTLTPFQKLLKSFSEKLGVPLKFFSNPDGKFHGSFSNGVLFLNVNSKKGLGGVFWHEAFHWLKANNPKLYAKLVDAAGITDKDRQAFLDRTGRKDLKTNEEIDEEILADQMDDVAKRTGLLQTIAGKNRGAVERVVQWLKDTMNKFIETFRNPTGRLTTKQAQALAKEFGQIARQLKDENGEQIFRVNNRTGDIEVVEGHKARELSNEEIETAAKSPNVKYSVDPNDNSSESLGQKIKNFASTVFNGKPQSKNHKQFIVDKLEELTRYKTYFNTNAKNEADVIVDSFQKIIRARHAYDFEKLLPATGEPIAKVLGLNPSEAMSNYIADWMMTGAINNASKEATAFQKAMRAHPAEAELLQSIRDTFQTMANMTAEEAVESNIVRGKKSKTFREWLGEKFSKEEWVDDLHPIKRAYDQMLAKAPPAVADIIKKNFDPYMSASLFRGKGAIADMMIGESKEVTDKDIETIRTVLQREFPNVNFSDFKPLAAIAKMVGNDVEGLERYALAKLDKEMHEKKNSGDAKYANLTPSYTEAQCDEIIKAGKAKYDAAQRELVNYANTLAAIQYSTGVISANQFYQRVNGWENYVPTARVFEEYEDISVDKSDSSKHKTGSKRRVYSPLGKLATNTDVFIRQSLQNRARLEIVTMARLGNFGDIFAETPKGYPQGHTIHFKENGKMKYLVTPDESLKRAVESIQTPADANIVVQAFKTAGMIMRGLYTMVNFEFMSGNPFRDLQDAFIHNKYGSRNPFVAIPAMVSAAVSGFAQSVGAQIKSEEFRTFLAEGGAQSGFSYEITEGSSKRVNSFGKKSLAKSTWDKFLMIAEASENMTRFSTFKTAKDNLAKQHGGVPTPHDLKLAAMQARRATVDFARAGHTMRGVNKVALFSNAAMQSLALWGEKINAFRKGKEGAGKELFAAVFKTIMGGVMPALAFAALNFSDDERRKRFEERHTWEKDTYWIFGDGLRVPKGMDLGIKLTSALTEEFAMWLASNKPVEWKRIVNNIGRGLPSITTTIFTPAVESYMNYSIFKDAPIVPYGQQDDPKYKQYGKNTSWVAKQLGKTFNLSPRQIDHLIAGYGGSMATALTGGSDGIPVVRRFMFDPDKNPRIVQDYYKALEEQEEMLAEYKARRADGEKVELPEDYDRGLHARLKKSREAMTRISKAEMRIMDDPKLDADKRKEKLRELEKRRVALCERVLGKAR